MTEQNASQTQNLPQADTLLEKYDRESAYRKKLGKWAWVVSFLAISLTLFHLYTASFGILRSQMQGAIHLGTALGLIFLLYPAKKGLQHKQKGVPWYDVILAFTALFVGYYFAFFLSELTVRIPRGNATELDIIVATLGVVLVLEATRRCVGLPIVVIATLFIIYALFGQQMPFFPHRGFTWENLATRLYFSTEAIFGTPIQVSSKFIFLFLFFGVLLIKTGIGQFFNDLAFALTGRFTGGTAKAAVAASALQGTVTGSSVANTVSSGSFTIPLMKKSGFKPEFAAAAEASASTGGQIMPPIMGAAAFLLAEYTRTPYSQVMLAALIPALLYFSGVFMGVHFESKKLGIKGLPKEKLPDIKEVVLRRGYMILPLVLIFSTLLMGFSPIRAALVGITTAFVLSFFRKETRFSFKDILETLEQGARVALPVIAACATAGIIAGIVVITGLGGKLAGGIINLSGGILLLTLVYTMLACILLGMGLPTTANYVVTASIAAPAIVTHPEFAVPVLAAHMFVFYFGIVADITPPVCLAAYAGSGIARSNPFMTGVTAVKLAVAAYIIPYIFVFNPQLILIDYAPLSLAIAVITALLGMIGISSSVMGFFIRHSRVWERIVLFAGGLLLISPNKLVDLAGLALLALIWFIQKQRPDDSDFQHQPVETN
ncbi:TRAP transporter, 4TM/12TM fusion protein [Caldalkalibacillus thermarum TA2.A1]|uniref:TRAP transporter, 4TM/12TM fusion protein n=1 Tax=Caldalkalibacillus thermarum (strain TA2.A1) TaxID=986075 RepID=F5L922_CALTT|nr:TRAP transporter permease [Caldalkalibacillus thermarum]EGL82196.1 TRAP transporter, 4TM/12TM fusion protein [Caldalkalibacillus thermarum TA2.A1]